MPADATSAALQPSHEVLELIRTLVAFDTVSRNSNLGLIEWVRDRLRAQGRAIVYITHRMPEIRRLADRVTVLKDGKVAAASIDAYLASLTAMAA